MASDYAIEVKGLTKSFKQTSVLKGIDLKVHRGTIFALLGPNGAGKTTTVKIITTLLRPDEGEAKVHGCDVVTQADRVRSVIGLTGQYAAVDEYLNAYENLEMIGRLYHLSREDTKQRTQELLEQLDLIDAAKRPVKTYSGGMRRRLDLALSLIASPPIIFLDEPTTGLDPRSRLTVWSIVKKLADEGATILLTTQYLEEADQLADRIAVIDNGKVIAEGTPDELKQKVGKDRLELTIDKDSNFDEAQKIITGDAVNIDSSRRIITVATEDSVADLRHLLERLDQKQIKVESLSLHKPTLDDVFLTLTGHEATTTQPEGE